VRREGDKILSGSIIRKEGGDEQNPS